MNNRLDYSNTFRWLLKASDLTKALLNNRLQALNIQTTGLQNGVNSFVGNVTNNDKLSAEVVIQSATQPFLMSSRNAPPTEWGGALRDDTKTDCVAD